MAVAVTNEIPTKSFVAEQEATNHENLRTTGLNPIGRHKINFELSSYKVISCCVQDVMDEWMVCQRSWLYLEPIFSSEDINRQLPVEGKRYQTMERMWRKLMKNAKENTQVGREHGYVLHRNYIALEGFLRCRSEIRFFKAQLFFSKFKSRIVIFSFHVAVLYRCNFNKKFFKCVNGSVNSPCYPFF